jgi:hypothetical protein
LTEVGSLISPSPRQPMLMASEWNFLSSFHEFPFLKVALGGAVQTGTNWHPQLFRVQPRWFNAPLFRRSFSLGVVF